jgi:hypothetical protein
MDDQELPRSTNEIPEATTPEQARWVLWRLVTKTDQEAAKKTGVHPSTVSKWENKADLDAAVLRLLSSPTEAVMAILHDAAIAAAQVKVAGLGSKSESVRQGAATEILDRNIGKPMQKQEISGPEGGPLEHTYDVSGLDDNQLLELAARYVARIAAGGAGDGKS